jgi:uncharacterized protein (TIGR03066 family)
MRMVRYALASLMLVGATALVAAAPPSEKLVGKWEAVKGTMPAGSILELTKDNKFTLTLKQDGKELFKIEGTFEADGEKSFTVKGKVGNEEKTQKLTIKELAAEKLVTEDEKGKSDEFKKLK